MPREKELYRDNLEIFTRRALERFPNKCIFTQKEAAELLVVNVKELRRRNIRFPVTLPELARAFS